MKYSTCLLTIFTVYIQRCLSLPVTINEDNWDNILEGEWMVELYVNQSVLETSACVFVCQAKPTPSLILFIRRKRTYSTPALQQRHRNRDSLFSRGLSISGSKNLIPKVLTTKYVDSFSPTSNIYLFCEVFIAKITGKGTLFRFASYTNMI